MRVNFTFHIFFLFKGIVTDFSARSLGIVQEAMKWAPQATRSHLQEYLNQIPDSVRHIGLALATESVLHNKDINLQSITLSVSELNRYFRQPQNIFFKLWSKSEFSCSY